MAILFFQIWPFRIMKNGLKYELFAKVGSQFCQLQNSNSRNGQKLLKILTKSRNFAKSGHTGSHRVLYAVDVVLIATFSERIRPSLVCPTILEEVSGAEAGDITGSKTGDISFRKEAYRFHLKRSF